MKEMIQKNIEEFSRLQDYIMASEKIPMLTKL